MNRNSIVRQGGKNMYPGRQKVSVALGKGVLQTSMVYLLKMLYILINNTQYTESKRNINNIML